MQPNQTPMANRRHVGIFGDTNSGKSMLFNRLLNQDLAIVSNQEGTTTDPITKGMELIPFGPIALIDTAGFGDFSVLGEERIRKTKQVLQRCDYVLYVMDVTKYEQDKVKKALKEFENVPHTIVFTKADLLVNDDVKSILQKEFPSSVFVSPDDPKTYDELKLHLSNELKKLGDTEENLLTGICEAGDHIVLVIPIDSAAPKGRLILPQVMLLRHALDLNVICTVTKEETLLQTLQKNPDVKLVVTDSQIFKLVANVVPENVRLTSFSMLMARQKGDINMMLKALEVIGSLKDGDRILMLEACTHNHTHEDIGRVKIPTLLQQKTGAKLEFDYFVSYDFPKDLSKYKLAIHCGGCMISKKAILSRMEQCRKEGLPITNYGVILSHLSGVSQRCSEVFSHD